LQCAAVCCSVLQCAAVCCSVLQCAAVCCSVLQCVAVCWQTHTTRKTYTCEDRETQCANDCNTNIPSADLRTGKEVSSRGLTLVEILAHSTHYNANMRKECLGGIRDFFELHPMLLSLHVGAVLEKVLL